MFLTFCWKPLLKISHFHSVRLILINNQNRMNYYHLAMRRTKEIKGKI